MNKHVASLQELEEHKIAVISTMLAALLLLLKVFNSFFNCNLLMKYFSITSGPFFFFSLFLESVMCY